MTDEDPDDRTGDERAQPEQPDDMAEADVANGEGPDEAVADEPRQRRATEPHPTGQRQAAANRADDPPA